MQKQIFSEEDIVQPTKTFQAKQIFDEKEVVIEEDLNDYQYLDESEVAEKADNHLERQVDAADA